MIGSATPARGATAAIRPESEADRTEAALAKGGLHLPLRHGEVEITVAPEAAESPLGQRLLTLLVNELARMKGVVRRVHLDCPDVPRMPGVPVRDPRFLNGLVDLVEALNAPESEHRVELVAERAPQPAARLRVGPTAGGGPLLAADGWRALLGDFAANARWHDSAPYGAAIAASLGAAEAYKDLLDANGAKALHLPDSFAFSTYNYGIDHAAEAGPSVSSLALSDVVVVGCGAGGTAALYVLAMQPGLSGEVALAEPGHHKSSNLNRYLMTTAADVHAGRHKLGTAVEHLATFAPDLVVASNARPWEQLPRHPWGLVLATADTIEARWAIQDRAAAGASILDGGVVGLIYSVLRVRPGGRCLECKHPRDPDLAIKQRAARWGQTVTSIRAWTAENRIVDREMLEQLANTQNRPVEDFAELDGIPFADAPRLTECGATPLSTSVPSQAPILPVTTTPLGVVLAAEVAKHYVAPDARLDNWVAHDLDRSMSRPWIKFRGAKQGCGSAAHRE